MNSNYEIQLVNQPDDLTCVAACMAMVSGKTLEMVFQAMSDLGQPPYSEEQMMIGLVRLGVLPRKQLEAALRYQTVYIADVPSLNKKRSMHAIVIDAREVLEVFDPQKGRPGKEWYSSEDLTGWSNLVSCVRV